MQSSASTLLSRIGNRAHTIAFRVSNLSTITATSTTHTSCKNTQIIRGTNGMRLHNRNISIARRSLSSASAVVEDEPPRRRNLETKDPIVLTERAADRIKTILQGENAEGALGIRLGVKRRGCNGLSYTLNYAFEKPKKDIEMQSNGVKVFVEPMALFNVVGTVMDWEETELSSEFTFKNPNSKGECGCGESFTV